MNTPNWITVTLKTACSDSDSYMGRLIQKKQTEQNCSFHAERNRTLLQLTCRQVSPLRYDFSVLDGDWNKEDVMAFCGMLLQCAEVDNVLVGWVKPKTEAKVMISPATAFWNAVKVHLQPQRLVTHMQYSHAKG